MLTTEQKDLIQKRYKIPCTCFQPDRWYIISLDQKSTMPTETELAQMGSYMESIVREIYTEHKAEQILAKELPAENRHNTVIFAKGEEAWPSAGKGWAHRQATWSTGPLYWSHIDTPARHEYGLVEIMDKVRNISEDEPSEEWESWKNAHPDIFPRPKQSVSQPP